MTTIEALHDSIPNLGPGRRAFVSVHDLRALLEEACAMPEQGRPERLRALVRAAVKAGRIVIVEDSEG